MAGDWIKVRDNLHEDPAVGQISTALALDPFAVVGRLIRVWTWADQQSRDGHAHVSHLFIDQLVSTPGMADAMVLVGWLEVPENGQILFPNYDRHMSKSAKKRALATRRKQLQRSHPPVTHPSRSGHAQGGTREEKSSSSNKHPTVASTSASTNAPRKVQGGLTTSTPARPQPPVRPPATGPLKPPAAMTDAEREAAGIAEPPADLVERYTKPRATANPIRAKGRRELEREPHDADEPSDDELLEQLRGPVTVAAAAKALDMPVGDAWKSSPDSIDHAGQVLGMQRERFEDDESYANRIEARIALG